MERHKCKLCFRSFSNGRALGGHMRSHMLSLPLPPKDAELFPPTPLLDHPELGEDPEFASQSNSDSDEKGLYYGLRGNPKKSVRLVDPEFSFVDAAAAAAATAASAVILSSGSKSTKRKRSQRKPSPKTTESDEPGSSVSDATTEDVAFCLMMMSQDSWYAKRRSYGGDDDEEEDESEEEDEEDDDEEEEFEELAKSSRNINGGSSSSRNKYRCETCDRTFRSYQALGGHRASHKKIRLSSSDSNHPESDRVNAPTPSEKKVHQCPVCFRVFASGQALGGHKRSHVIAGNSLPQAKPQTPAKTPESVTPASVKKFRESLFDLNLPAPEYEDEEEDEHSQVELSAVSDAEFVINFIRQ